MAQGAASTAIAFMQAKEGAGSRLSRGPPPGSRRLRSGSSWTGTARAYALDIVDREAVARAFAAAESELSPISRVERLDRA
jgi:hypothetical protein